MEWEYCVLFLPCQCTCPHPTPVPLALWIQRDSTGMTVFFLSLSFLTWQQACIYMHRVTIGTMYCAWGLIFMCIHYIAHWQTEKNGTWMGKYKVHWHKYTERSFLLRCLWWLVWLCSAVQQREKWETAWHLHEAPTVWLNWIMSLHLR